jgi:drug/metabolite transporter (DMT)-like permease
MRRYSHELGLAAVVLIWGANFSVLKDLFEAFHPYVVNALRLTTALATLVALLVLVVPRWSGQLREAVRTAGVQIAVLGLFGFVLYQVLFVEGVSRTSAASAALLMATAPLWTAVSAHVTRIERMGAAAWAALLVSVAGAMLVLAGSATDAAPGEDSLAGNAVVLVAALCWGLFTTLSRPLAGRFNATLLATLELAAALPLLLLLSAPLLPSADWSGLTLPVVAMLAFSGALSSGVTFVIWNRAVRHVGPNSTIAFANAVPLAAAAFGYLIRGTPVTWVQAAGGVLIVGGIVLLRRFRRLAARAPA